MLPIDSIILDVDGTLWDSTDIVAKAWTEIIRQETSLSLMITSGTLKSLFGRTLPNIAKILFPDFTTKRQLELIDLCCQREHELLSQTHEQIPLYEPLKETLENLSQKYPLYLVSNCEAGYIEVFLEHTKLGPYISDYLCAGDTGNAKAQNIIEIITRHQLHAPIYVGDTSGDYEATEEAGIPFVYASYGFGHVDAPDYTIEKISDLITLAK